MTEKRWQSVLWSRLASFLSRRSETSAQKYLYTWEEFLSWLGVESGTDAAAAAVIAVDETTAAEYLAEMSRRIGQTARATGRRRVSTGTVAYKLRKLRLFYRELLWAQLINKNPFEKLAQDYKFEQGDKRPTEAIAPEKIRTMLNLPDVKTWKGRRDKAFLAILFGCGLRLSEALSFRLRDIFLKRVESKRYLIARIGRSKTTNRPIELPLPAWTHEPILAWAAERKAGGAKPTDFFFGKTGVIENASQSRLSECTAYRLFKRYAEIAGLENKSPHSARASFATFLDSQGVPLGEIAQAMRHKNRTMTEEYIKRENPLTRSAALGATYGIGEEKKVHRRKK